MTGPTLYDDWKARRERLEEMPYWAGDYGAVERRLLDFLLRRYRDAPEAARPARFPLGTGLHVNRRAIVVFHHLWQDRVPKVTSAAEAQDRVRTIVGRMARPAPSDDAAGDLGPALGEPPPPEDPADVYRRWLCDPDPVVRMTAAVRLGKRGSLDDVGLLSDLLALPPGDDEHPAERRVLVHTMRRLAGIEHAPFDLASILPKSESAPAEPPDWKCPKCGADVPVDFDVCWSCGTTADGQEDPTFRRVDDE